MERTCGGCTACCKTHGVLEILKMAGVWCTHCKIGEGCGIYGERPHECQKFKCAWLMGVSSSRRRPDKTKVVPEYRTAGILGIVMWFWEVREGALESKFTKQWTERNLGVGNCVMHVSLSGSRTLYLRKGKDDSDLSFTLGMREQDVKIVPRED